MRGLRPPVLCRDIQSVIGLPSCRHDTKMPDLDGQAHSAFPVIRLGLSPGVAFSLPLRHGLSYMSIAECARLRLSFPYRNFQSLSEPRSCQVRYEKRLTRVRRILFFM